MDKTFIKNLGRLNIWGLRTETGGIGEWRLDSREEFSMNTHSFSNTISTLFTMNYELRAQAWDVCVHFRFSIWVYIVLEFILVPFCLMSRRSDKKEEETKYGDVVPCQFFACLNFPLVAQRSTNNFHRGRNLWTFRLSTQDYLHIVSSLKFEFHSTRFFCYY